MADQEKQDTPAELEAEQLRTQDEPRQMHALAYWGVGGGLLVILIIIYFMTQLPGPETAGPVLDTSQLWLEEIGRFATARA